jgi:hypothetical protein
MFWFGADGVLDHRLRGALDWIEAQLPTGIVPEPADRLLNVFARRWLEGPPTFPPPSPAAAPPVAPTVRGAAT